VRAVSVAALPPRMSISKGQFDYTVRAFAKDESLAALHCLPIGSARPSPMNDIVCALATICCAVFFGAALYITSGAALLCSAASWVFYGGRDRRALPPPRADSA
jgi:hypothetical protein